MLFGDRWAHPFRPMLAFFGVSLDAMLTQLLTFLGDSLPTCGPVVIRCSLSNSINQRAPLFDAVSLDYYYHCYHYYCHHYYH